MTPAEREAHIAAEIARIEAAPAVSCHTCRIDPESPHDYNTHLALADLRTRDIFRDPS